MVEKIRHIPGAVDAHVHQPDDLPHLNVTVDRTKAKEIGLSEGDVANSVLLSLSGSGVVQPTYWLDTKYGVQYLINTRVPEYAMNSVETFRSTPVEAGTNRVMEISAQNFITTTQTVTLSQGQTTTAVIITLSHS